MKTMINILAGSFFLFCLLCTQGASAQSFLYEDHTILIGPPTVPVNQTYVADISDYGWPDAATAQAQLDNWDRDLITLTLDYAAQKVTITLLTNDPAASGWDFYDWHSYLIENTSISTTTP